MKDKVYSKSLQILVTPVQHKFLKMYSNKLMVSIGEVIRWHIDDLIFTTDPEGGEK